MTAKLKLDIDRLHVESFGTAEPGGGAPGTVHARSEQQIPTFTCPPTAVAYTCTQPNTSVGQDCFCTESPTCYYTCGGEEG
ncbi:MAG TPA: hypothetical protein VEX86_26905 [Longimicrobium sp.]|nr:hypothetical protein [Longimicrobium sp.]